jgi:molybdopterin-containing oxidoreductase family molybdopterin binding subunit
MKRVGERGEGKWQRISWDEAIDTIAANLTSIKEKYDSKAVCFVTTSGYYGILNGFYGANIRFANLFQGTYASGALDSSMPLGMFQALGNPFHNQGNEAADLANAKTIIVWGSNVTESNLQNWHFIADAIDNGGRLVAINPNFAIAASKADIWVPVRPGSDAALALAMVNVIIKNTLYDQQFLLDHTVASFLVRQDNGQFLREKDVVQGGSDKCMVLDQTTQCRVPEGVGSSGKFPECLARNQAVPFDASGITPALTGTYSINGIQTATAFQLLSDLAEQYSPDKSKNITDVPEDIVEEVAREYATSKPATIYWGFGLDRYYHGDLTGRALAILAALTGNIGRPGATPWGGFGGATLVSSPLATWKWTNPTETSANFLNNLLVYDAIEKGEPYPIKALVVTNSNYVITFPNQNKILHDLFPKLDFIVVADLFMTDTAKYADVVLPSTSWFENEDVVTSMHPHIMFQEKAIEPLYECKSDLEIFTLLGRKMGAGEQWNKTSEEYIQLIFDDQNLRDAGITLERLKSEGSLRVVPAPYIPFQDLKFGTPSDRIEFYSENLIEKLPVFHPPIEAWPDNALATKYPLVCIQAGSRFRVHTQYFNTPWLRELDPHPFVEVNPSDAKLRGINDGDVVVVYNDRGNVTLHARLNEALRPGMINISRGCTTSQFIGGNSQQLIADYRNPDTLNCSFFDTLAEVKKA